MDEMNVEKSLRELGQGIYVNEELKRKLRDSFTVKKRFSISGGKKMAAIAAVLCLFTMGYMIFGFMGTGHVSAASLKIENYSSLISMGDGRNLPVCENNGTIYMPVFTQGIFSYNINGINRIYEGHVNYVSASQNGKILLFTEEGSIKTLDIESGKVNEILIGDNKTLIYEQPSWLTDGSAILYNKTVSEINTDNELLVKDSGIYRYDFASKRSVKIAEGSYASFIKRKNAVVFEREEKVVYKSLDDNSEVIIDDGKHPYASPDGNYIVFTKFDMTIRNLKENVMIEEGLQNIYIADTDNFNVRKRVTSNIILRDIDEKEWLSGLKPSDSPQVLSLGGRYCYLYPIWSSDSKSIISLRKEFPSAESKGPIKMKIVRINLESKELSAKDTVKRYLQAKVSDDDDYASALIGEGHESEDVKGYNITGYKVSESSHDKDYIDADVYLKSNDSLSVIIQKIRYYTGQEQAKTPIIDRKTISTIEVVKDNDTIYIKRSGEERKKVISIRDIPKDYFEGNDDNITSIEYLLSQNMLCFTIENNNAPKKSLKTIGYVISSSEYKLIDEYICNQEESVKVYKISSDFAGEIFALDYLLNVNGIQRNVAKVYRFKDQIKKIINEDFRNSKTNSIRVDFWDNDELVLTLSDYDQNMRLIYLPHKNEYGIYK